ncbi:MAG: MGMT family protein [Gammaproteobacteria bacterium]|nr:MGMT family protein [Gammaproteobacteria bacterium]
MLLSYRWRQSPWDTPWWASSSTHRRAPTGPIARPGLVWPNRRPGSSIVRRNPIPIIVPCHRVLAASGIGGYAGATAGGKLDIKRALLMHEG